MCVHKKFLGKGVTPERKKKKKKRETETADLGITYFCRIALYGEGARRHGTGAGGFPGARNEE